MATIRSYQPGDEQGIARLFEIVFGQPMALESWRWKYGPTPIAWVGEDGGELVCHVGARRQTVRWRGEEWPAFDVVDVMSHPDRRGRGLFRQAAQEFFRAHCDGQVLLVYGFPGEEHRRLGESLLDYQPVAPISCLRKSVPGELPALPDEIALTGAAPEDWDRHWAGLEDDYGLVRRRDRRYLDWRYPARPDRRYRMLAVPGKPALAVLGVEGERGYLMELLASRRDPAQAARLVLAVEIVARHEGVREIQGWFPSRSSESRLLAGACGFRVESAGHYLECTRRDPRLALEWLAEGFFYTLGDYDVH